MHPAELWWLIEARMPSRTYAGLPEHEMADLYDELVEMGFFEENG